MTGRTVPVCLSIGTSDSSGGAGIQGDVKALAAVGCFAATVVVGVTAQNTRGIASRYPVPLSMVRSQFDAVLGDLEIAAIKVGATWSPELVDTIADLLEQVTVPIVVDPVLASAAGSALGSDIEMLCARVRQRLFPLASVVTPNAEEARALAGLSIASSHEELAKALRRAGARAVVVSADHDTPLDVFCDSAGLVRISGERHSGRRDHGAGCAHSATIAGLLAFGVPVAAAVRSAHELVADGVRHALSEVGSGISPVDMLPISRMPVAKVVPQAIQAFAGTARGQGRVSK